MGFDGSVVVTEDTGMAAGPPDPSGAEPTLPDTELGTALRALSTVTDREAESDQVDGRAVWRMEGPLERDGTTSAGRVVLVVDKVRLAPMSVDLLDGDRVVRALRFDEVTFDVAAPGPFRGRHDGRRAADGRPRLPPRHPARGRRGRREPSLATDLPAGRVRARRHRAPRGRRDRVAPLPARGRSRWSCPPDRRPPSRARDPFERPEPVEPEAVRGRAGSVPRRRRPPAR